MGVGVQISKHLVRVCRVWIDGCMCLENLARTLPAACVREVGLFNKRQGW